MPEQASTATRTGCAIPRHLAVVLLELFECRDQRQRLDKRLIEMSESDPDRRDVEDRFGDHDTAMLSLEREARGMIEAATGVPWGYIERAGL